VHPPLKLLLCLLALATLTACGAGGGGPRPDGGAPDGGGPVDGPAGPDGAPDAAGADADRPDRSLEVLDWRTTRGAPLETTTLELPERDVFAVHAGGFVTIEDCVAEVGCDYEWLDLSGQRVRRREDLLAVHGTMVSPDGTRLHVVAREGFELCGPGPSFPVVVTGTLQLLELATGSAHFELALRTSVYFESAFSSRGGWFRVDPLPEGACGVAAVSWRAMAAPHLPPAYTDPDFYPLSELATGAWAGFRGDDFGTADPRREASFVPLATGVSGTIEAGGWLHAFEGYGDLTEVIVSIDPEGVVHRLVLPQDGDYRGRDALGRWVLACTSRQSGEQLRDCHAFDVTGAVPRRSALMASVTPYAAFVGKGTALVYVAPAAAGQPGHRLVRLQLATGVEETVHEGAGTLHFLGDGEAVLWQHEEGVILVEAEHAQLVHKGPAEVITAPGPPRGPTLPRQRWLAVLVATRAFDDATLTVLDLATRRLVTLTDRVYRAPRVGLPFAFDDCGLPWVTRSAGPPVLQLAQEGRHFYFVEWPTEAGVTDQTLWILPADLSAPPRRLAAMHPIYCHAPMASPGGEVVLVDVDHWNGRQSLITIARP
jgi:hypothetical protein